MNPKRLIVFLLLVSATTLRAQQLAESSTYLSSIKSELIKEWPKNKTINLVFHGHSVPAGYFKTPVVNTLESYPFLILKKLKEIYPFAVINVINTSIGGENSENGEKRFEAEVLTHRPLLIFIDYALNDRGIGFKKAAIAWEKMILKAKEKDIKVILLSPTPDQRVNILEEQTDLDQHTQQIRELAQKHGIGFIDNYQLFKQKAGSGENISRYMSQVNHPNAIGHDLIATEIMHFFK